MPGMDLSKQFNSSSLPQWSCDLAHTGEAFISYRERQKHPARPAVTPAVTGQPAVTSASPGKEGSTIPNRSRSSPSTPGPVLQALLCISLTETVLSPGGDEAVGIRIVLKYVLQNIYREI